MNLNITDLKMVKLNKKPAKSTSVKVGNKKQNKLNKQKQRTKKAAKNAKPIALERNGKVFSIIYY